jgi:hypothetical protein
MGKAKERTGRRALLRGATANVLSLLRSLLLLFRRKRPKDISSTETPSPTPPGKAITNTPEIAITSAPERAKVMSSGFDMQTEIAKLAERIIEPVAVKLTAQERQQVVGQIRAAFEQLSVKYADDTTFENRAVDILKAVQPRLTEIECTRMLDRLGGAMAAFCQVDSGRDSGQRRAAES